MWLGLYGDRMVIETLGLLGKRLDVQYGCVGWNGGATLAVALGCYQYIQD